MKLSHLAPALVAVACAACSSKPAPRVPVASAKGPLPDHAAAANGKTAAEAGDGAAREAPLPAQTYRVSLLRGDLTATVHAVSPPKVKTTSDDDGDLVSTLHIELGGDHAVECTAQGTSLNAATTAALALQSRSEEHTSELQSPCNLVCRLLLEKKKNKYYRFSNLKKKKNKQ